MRNVTRLLSECETALRRGKVYQTGGMCLAIVDGEIIVTQRIFLPPQSILLRNLTKTELQKGLTSEDWNILQAKLWHLLDEKKVR